MKERIIGAVVLVIIVVLVVPVFLDGPPEQGETISERVLLPGQQDGDTKTVVLQRERSAPIPLVETGQTAPSETGQDTVAQAQPRAASLPSPAPAESSPPVQEPAAEALAVASTTGMWAVQLGSFSSEENAENLAASLRRKDYAAFVSQHSRDGKQFFRVRVGPQKDRASADAMAARLLQETQEARVVPHP